MLNSIRNNRATQNTISVLNERVNKKFQKAKLSVLLTTTNKKAQDYNEKFLNQINEEEKVFTAEVEDIENMNNFPANYELKIKVGAQVMMLNNDSSNRWVNGSIGVVQSIEKSLDLDEDILYVKFQNGRVEPVDCKQVYHLRIHFLFGVNHALDKLTCLIVDIWKTDVKLEVHGTYSACNIKNANYLHFIVLRVRSCRS